MTDTRTDSRDSGTDNQGSGENQRSLNEIVDAIRSLGQVEDRVTVEDLVGALGRASGISVTLLAAAVATTPLSGIPGLSAFCGIIILISSVQLFFGRKSIWLPGFIQRRDVDGNRLRSSTKTLVKAARFLDRHTRERLSFLVRGASKKVIELVCTMGGAIMPFLELIPFSASVAGGTVALLCVALLTLDGLWVIFAGTFMVIVGTTLSVIL